MKKRLLLGISVIGATLLLASLASATPLNCNTTDCSEGVTLRSLVTGGANVDGFLIGDKLFNDFAGILTRDPGDGGTATPISLTGITVTPKLFGANYGFELNSLFSAAGGTTGAFVDLTVDYLVTVSDPSQFITDYHLSISGISHTGPGGYTVGVGESFYTDSSLGTPVGSPVAIFAAWPTPLSATTVFVPGLKSVFVTKDIGVSVGVDTRAQLSIVDQYPTQGQVPEPASLVLLGTGLLGLGMLSKKGFGKKK